MCGWGGCYTVSKKKVVDVWEVRGHVVESFPCFSLLGVSGVGYLQAGEQRGSLGDPPLLESRIRPGRRPLSLERALDGAVGVRRNKTGNMVSKGAQA